MTSIDAGLAKLEAAIAAVIGGPRSDGRKNLVGPSKYDIIKRYICWIKQVGARRWNLTREFG
jgi:hypothetical protein